MIKWYGRKIADAGFVINLSSRADRLNNVWKTLESVNITGVQRFNAIQKHRDGCTLSHIEIAKLQIKNNWDYVLYLEDDIKLDVFYDPNPHEDPTSISDEIDIEKVIYNIKEDLLKYNPDVLWLGTRPEGPVTKVSNMFLRPVKTVMSHAYLGSLKYAKFLVNNLNIEDGGDVTKNWPIDFFISELNNKKDHKLYDPRYKNQEVILNNDLKIYMTLPNIFIQGPSYSDMDNIFADHKLWIKCCFEEWIKLPELNIKKFLKNE